MLGHASLKVRRVGATRLAIFRPDAGSDEAEVERALVAVKEMVDGVALLDPQSM